tara:strand:+ start:10417 stop:13080 length:2664 start_codon:yes stop_codon:yes gene_type:complete
MATARKDFENFVRWLHDPDNEAPSNVRRLANSILSNFDAVLATSRQRSQRSVFLATLARNLLLQTSDDLPEIAPLLAGDTWQWQRLHHLTVGPFRGFLYPEPFDLHNRIVLFYGPNGSGKTSLCEALEYSLLGSVEEAGVKRIAPATYLSNLHARRFEPPVLRATDHQGNEINVTANADSYRFSFIEKNRIDSFSRIAARPTAQRAELIATLFGMEKFNDFVSHFNDSTDEQLTLIRPKQIRLDSKREALAQDQETVNRETELLQTLDAEELALAQTHSDAMTYGALKELIGSPETPARLQELNEILNAIPPQILNITRTALQECYEQADAAQNTLDPINTELMEQANLVSFKDLYTAVIELQPTEGAHCPACDTPLEGVQQDPYAKAATGLEQLSELAAVQIQQEQAIANMLLASNTLKAKLEILRTFIESGTEQELILSNYLSELANETSDRWWQVVYDPGLDTNPEANAPTLEGILGIAQQIETQDIASRLAQEERQRNIEERDSLNAFQLLIQTQDNKRQLFIEKLAAAKQRIADFEETNAALIQEAAQENRDNERDTPIKVAYDHFLRMLRRYRNELPGTLMAGLNDQAMMLYNEFNRNDLEADKLSSLYLPLTGEEKIQISFRGSPQLRIDALKILSEGHIRCLGLAILLAKSMKIESPLIVFDDAINAIDHDHKRGIRETIFESDHFANTQIIVTCHSNDFIKDIQQSLPQPVRNDSKVYLFKNHDGNYQPRVNGNVTSRNYIDMARAAREELNDGDALAASRKAIEMFSDKIWRWLGSHDHGHISVLLLGSGKEPALRSLCESLRHKLNNTEAFAHNNKQPVITALNTLLGIPEQNLVWRYLNKGAHEEADRDDFDSDIVESVVATLEELEGLDLRPGR